MLIAGVLFYFTFNNAPKTDNTSFECHRIISYPQLHANYQKVKTSTGTTLYLNHSNRIALGDVICVDANNFSNNKSYKKYADFTIKESNDFLKNITDYRQQRIEIVLANVKQPYDNLILGISMGYDGEYPAFYLQLLKDTGLMHLFVASGSNIALLLATADFLFKKFSIKLKVLLSLFFASFYVLLVGPEIPILRAYFSYLVMMYSRLRGSYFTSFSNTTLVMLAFLFMQPELISDISFQLSFVATYAVLIAGLMIDFLQIKNQVITQFLFHVLIFILMLPIVIHYFGSVNLFAPVFNFLVSYIMTLCFVVGIVTFFLYSNFIGHIVVMICYPLNFIIQLCEFELVKSFIVKLYLNQNTFFSSYFFLIISIMALMVAKKRLIKSEVNVNSTQ